MITSAFVMLLAITATAGAAAPAVDASKLTLSVPVTVVELDLGKLKGQLSRLSWSPDGQQLYVQTMEAERTGIRMRHFLVGLDGRPPSSVDQQPVWATAYWAWKSGQAAPGVQAFKIDIEQQDKRVTATSTPMGGDMAKGGSSPGMGGLSTEEATDVARQSQNVRLITLRLKGEVVGQFTNASAMPGLTFGWGPAGMTVIAFANPDGRLVVMDDQGRKQEVPSSKESLLPAWSNDGKRLAYLEKAGRKKFVLKIVDVAKPAS